MINAEEKLPIPAGHADSSRNSQPALLKSSIYIENQIISLRKNRHLLKGIKLNFQEDKAVNRSL